MAGRPLGRLFIAVAILATGGVLPIPGLASVPAQDRRPSYPGIRCLSAPHPGFISCHEAYRRATAEDAPGGTPSEITARLVRSEGRDVWVVRWREVPLGALYPPYNCIVGNWIVKIDARTGDFVVQTRSAIRRVACPGRNRIGVCPYTRDMVPVTPRSTWPAVRLVRQWMREERRPHANPLVFWEFSDPWLRQEIGWKSPGQETFPPHISPFTRRTPPGDPFYRFIAGGARKMLSRNGGLSPRQNRMFLFGRASIFWGDCNAREIARITRSVWWIGGGWPDCQCVSPLYAFVANRKSGLKIFAMS